MTERSLADLGWLDVRSAAWWLGLLYRRPHRLSEALEALPKIGALRAGAILLSHAIVYAVIIAAVGRLLLFGGLGFSMEESAIDGTGSIFQAHVEQLVKGIAGGIAFGIAGGIAGGIAVGIVVGIAGGIAFGIACGIAFGIASLRAYYYPWHLLLRFFAPTAGGYRLHPAAFDDLCSLPFLGLDRFLLACREMNSAAGDAEIERLITSYPSQRVEALKARSAVIAREAAASDLSRVDALVDRLPEGEKGFLKETPRVREMVGEIAEAKRRLDTADRPFIREPYAQALVSKIEAFRGQVSGFREPLASEFRKAADVWLTKARSELEQVTKITEKEPTPQVFRAGDPVDRSQEAFVPRMGVIGQVERQLTLATGCPGLLIYGRRRMGKSTLIRNLDAFVPPSVKIGNISLQNPAAFTSLGHFVRLVDRELTSKVQDAETLRGDDLEALYQRLDQANDVLESTDRRLAVALDEFENIDRKIGEGVFPMDLLATLRESIQSHRRLIWVFCGSHHITELTNAEWPSYLVSAQTIEIPPFSLAETRLLLTDPLKQSPLYARDVEKRPRFDPGFWGEGGIEWILEQTAGWPHLVQLLASTAVDLANECVAHGLDQDMLEAAAEKSITLGDTVLRQLVHGESRTEAEKAYIGGFRRTPTQPPPADEAALQSFRHRQIVSEDGDVWRLRVPLMQRWLEARG